MKTKLEELKKRIQSDKELLYIKREDAEEIMGEEEYKEMVKWMWGQASFIEGPYFHDIENFYRNKERGTLDKLPWGF